jgi:hypothetical protein
MMTPTNNTIREINFNGSYSQLTEPSAMSLFHKLKMKLYNMFDVTKWLPNSKEDEIQIVQLTCV